jgi:hypothetical protein
MVADGTKVPAHEASYVVNGTAVNGSGVNGTNGTSVNGIGVNGIGVNGTGVNGTGMNGIGAVHNSPHTVQIQEPIAVVGVACRLPGHCTDPHKLWEFVVSGGVATADSPPESRFSIRGHYDGSLKPHTMRSPGGMFLEDIDLAAFDAPFFGVNRTDAIAMDPQQRQLLEVVYECLENAGISLDSISGSTVGCFVGSYAVGMWLTASIVSLETVPVRLRLIMAHGKTLPICRLATRKIGRSPSPSALGVPS